MDATTWLRHVGSYCAEPLHGPKLARLVAFGLRVEGEFPAHAFTTDTARKVAKALPDTHPTYDAIAGALRFAMPADAAPAPQAEAGPRAPFPADWVGDRLRAGADKAHILSLIRTYNPPAVVRAIMAVHFPTEHAAEEARAAEVARDKARNAADPAAARARVAAALGAAIGNAWRAPPLHAGPSGAQPEARPEPPPAPERPPPRLAEQLRRLEIEAASNDPPPNAAARIAALRQQLAQEAPA